MRVNLLPATANLDRGDGTCIHFDDAHKLCKIYKDRPDICRVDRQYETNYRHVMTWDDFVKLNLAGCEKIQTVLLEN